MNIRQFVTFAKHTFAQDMSTAAIRRELDGALRSELGRPQLPNAGDVVSASYGLEKTSALVFDRVWTFPGYCDPVPPDIAVYGATEAEIWLALGLMAVQKRTFEDVKPALEASPIEQFRGQSGLRRLSEYLWQQRKIRTTPMYDSVVERETQYQAGARDVIVATMCDIKIVDEDKLEWEQVRQFRADPEARQNFRRLTRWLDSEMLGKSLSFVEDSIAIKLEQYELALKKHGVETIVGSIESILDVKLLTGTSALFTALALGTNVTAATTASVAVLAGKVTCSAVRGLMNITAAKRGDHAEVAFVSQVKQLAS